MNISFHNSVGEAVAEDYRAAAIFEKYGIDFCCKGHKSIDEACGTRNIPTEEVMRELKMLSSLPDQNYPEYLTWPVHQLTDYIEEKHHRYVEEKTPVIMKFLDKLCHVHGPRHPELYEIKDQFYAAASELAQHMKKEELILFPRIRKMGTLGHGQPVPEGIVSQPIEMMMHEHDQEGERFRRMSELSNGFLAPEDACNTYRVTYALLQEFENDLHLHIHLENNILFPKAMNMEKELLN